MKNILVPTDFSPTADHAFQLALQIAKKENVNIHLLHVLGFNFDSALELDKLFPESPFGKEALDHFMKGGHDELNSYIDKLKLDHNNVKKVVEIGVPSDIIIEKIKKLDIDMVVMGTQGATGMKEFFLGSNAERVVRYADCPVITIKHKINIDEVKRIVFGSDLNEISDKVIEKLKELQGIFQAEIDIVRVNTPNNFERDIILKPLKERMLSKINLNKLTVHTYNDLTIENGLRHYAQENGAQMIAITTHGRKGFDHFVAGSIAEDITNRTTKMVWTYHFQ
ncbi:MAG TPA: universal stress protein [Fulvivirga sp.]|nr:universal stress protein [Fulvivirga sp.]